MTFDEELNIQNNSLEKEFKWLRNLINQRISEEIFEGNDVVNTQQFLNDFPIDSQSSFGQYIHENQLTFFDRFILVVTLAKYLKPSIFASINNLTQFGLINDDQNNAKPTLKTVLCLWAGKNEAEVKKAFGAIALSKIVTEGVVKVGGVKQEEETVQSDELTIGLEFIQHFTEGGEFRPDNSSSFPAKLVKTNFQWDDLVVNSGVKNSIQHVIDWITHGNEIVAQDADSGKIGPSFPVLFYGPPGTGKTMAAGLIGKFTNKPVYRVDLSLITSKYVGETQKNLAILFNRAQNKNWILFFDEADALFGKRTGVKDAHDKFANQEMSYILQRIEEFSSVVILATNYSDNIDEAMTRRFQSKIYFGLPDETERQLLWEKSIPKGYNLASDIEPQLIAKHYKLTGANIRNIVKMLTVAAKSKNINTFTAPDIQERIILELAKEGKTL